MKDEDKSKEQLINELLLMRERTAQMEEDLAKLRLLAEALRESEERIRAFVDHAPTIAWMKDEHGRHVYLNKACENRFGVRPEDWSGKTDFELWPQEVAEEFRRNDQAVLTSGQVLEVMEETLGVDGNCYYWWNYRFPFTDASGKRYVGGMGMDITERIRTEDALRVSRERLGLGQRAAKTGFWDWEMSTGKLTWSEEFYELFCLAPGADPSFETWLNTLHADDRKSAMEKINRSISARTPLENEYRIVCPDGRERWITALGDTFYDDAGRPQRMCGICTDITVHKRAEEETRRSETALRSILNAVTESVFMMDVEGTVLVANATTAGRLGKNVENLVGRCIYDLVPGELASFRKGRLKAVIQSGQPIRFEDEREGRWYESSVYPVSNAEGRITQFAIFEVDATERKRAEEALRESEERWQFALEGAGDGAWDWNAQTNEVFFSRQWKAMLGYEEDEIGNTLDEWDKRVHPEDKGQCYADLEEHFRGKRPVYQNEHRLLCKDGKYKWILDRGKVIEWADDGRPLRVIGTHTDITERKQAEEEFRALTARHLAILEAIPDIIMEVDANKIYRWANNAGFEFFGEDVLGKAADYYFEGEQDTYGLIQPLFIGDENVIYVESWQRRKDGEKRLLAWWCRVLKDANGIVIGALSTARDITESKRAEEKVREQVNFLRTLFDTIPNPIFHKDANGCYTGCNQAFLKFTGKRPEEVLGKTVHDMGPKDIADHYAEKDRELFEHPGRQHYEWQVQNALGEVREVIFDKATLLDAHGAVTGLIGVISDITDRKRTENALVENENRYRSLFEMESDAIFLIDNRTGQLLEANRAACLLYGYSRDELLARKNTDLSAEPEETQRQTEETPILPDNMVTIPLRIHRKKDGTEFPVEITGRFFIWDGRPHHIAAIRDITERRLAEEALCASERFASETVDALSENIAILDEEGRILTVNESWRDFARKNASSLNGLIEGANYLEVCSNAQGAEADQAAEFAEGIRSVMRGEREQFMLEYSCHSPWEKRWFIGRVTRFRGEGPVRIVVAHQSITERKRAEEALRESEERYRMIFDHSPLGIMHFDSNGIIRDFNDKFAQIIGASRQAILEFEMLERLRDPAMLQAVKDALDGRLGYYEGDYLSVTGGKSTPMRAIYQRITDEDEKIVGAVGLFEDVTERKRAEEEREKLEAHLRQAQKMEAIGTLAGGIAHDFNNVLSAIIGFTELSLGKAPPDSPIQADLQQVLLAAERAKELVKQILTFSRQSEQEVKPVRIVPLLKEALKFLRASIPSTIAIRQHIRTSSESTVVGGPDPDSPGRYEPVHQCFLRHAPEWRHAWKWNCPRSFSVNTMIRNYTQD